MPEVISLIPPVLFDTSKWSSGFGNVTRQPKPYVRPGETVSARFVSILTRKFTSPEGQFLKSFKNIYSSGTIYLSDNLVRIPTFLPIKSCVVVVRPPVKFLGDTRTSINVLKYAKIDTALTINR